MIQGKGATACCKMAVPDRADSGSLVETMAILLQGPAPISLGQAPWVVYSTPTQSRHRQTGCPHHHIQITHQSTSDEQLTPERCLLSGT